MLKIAANVVSSLMVLSSSFFPVPLPNIESRGEILRDAPEEKLEYMINHYNSAEDIRNIARGFQQLAKSFDKQCRPNDAEVGYLFAISLLERVSTKNDPEVGLVYERLAGHYAMTGAGILAKKANSKALSILRLHPSEYAIELALVLHNQAWLELYDRKSTKAERCLQESIELLKTQLGEHHLLVGLITNALGELYLEQDDFKKAEPYLKSALEIVQQTSDSKEILNAIKSNYVLVLRKNHKYSAAKKIEENIQ